MRVSHGEMRPQLLPLRHSHQHATYLRRLHPVPPSTVWVVPFPAAGDSPFRDDHGSAEPRVAAALAAFGSGQGSEHAALTALASSRLLVPIVAVAARGEGEPQGPGRAQPDGGPDSPDSPGRVQPDGGPDSPGRAQPDGGPDSPDSPGRVQPDGGPDSPDSPGRARPDGHDSGAEMSLPTLVGRDGRRAIPAFTCVETLTMWRQSARPVPTPAARVWRAAAEDACAVVVDVAGPVPIAIDGARLAALASGRPVPLPHEDPDVLAAVRAAAAAQPAIAGLSVTGPDGGSDLQLNVTLADACTAPDGREALSRLAADVMASLGGRLRRGIAVAVIPAAPAAGRQEP
jgi:SseB protein N-terminal domain